MTLPTVDETPDTTEGTEGATSEAPDVAAALATIMERLDAFDGRLALTGKDLGRLRERLPAKTNGDATSPKPTNGATPAVGMSREDVLAGIKLGGVVGKLPEDAAEYINEMVEAGESFASALKYAEAIQRFGKQQAPATGGFSPTGQAASAAPRTSPGWPESMSALVKLATSNPKQYEELMSPGSDFDPNLLPPR